MFKLFKSTLQKSPQKEQLLKTDPLDVLKLNYHNLFRLAEQITTHAQSAPYPSGAKQLRKIADEKHASASLLKKEILKLGGQAEEAGISIKGGKNHWERMTRDLEDQSELGNQLIQYAISLAEKAPEISGLLRQIAAEQGPHRESFLDMVARADPQAYLTGV